ncbi:kinase-like protein [Tothia fuscella]|uniref:non-specific serine/threonine protein kinase n=1 Tax=Tothia fuscella TaxID=1048955 RepID=A0A9P4NHE1_9PEZI|nr:kinase-like protein [Tothia fuscella]
MHKRVYSSGWTVYDYNNPETRKTRTPSRSYYPCHLEECERVEEYKPGGFHPVNMGDRFGVQGRYCVYNKLGYGGFATIWLARDLDENRNVALKILRANSPLSGDSEVKILEELQQPSDHPGREHIRFLLDSFKVEGPNGTHQCLVMEVAGPSLADLCRQTEKDPWQKRFRKYLGHKFATQAVQAVAYLHSKNIAHGDINAQNLLIRLADFAEWSPQETDRRVPLPWDTEVLMIFDDVPHNPSAPRRMMEPFAMDDIYGLEYEERVFLIDFGQSFIANTQPCEQKEYTLTYSAPELIINKEAFLKTDIWALGCTLYQIRSGSDLFDGFLSTLNHVLLQTVEMLGKLPDDMWSKWEGRGRWFDEHGVKKEDPGPVDEELGDMEEFNSLKHYVDSIRVHNRGEKTFKSQQYQARWVEKMLMDPYGTALSDEEVDNLADLLDGMLTYDIEARMSAEDVLQHRWLSGNH